MSPSNDEYVGILLIFVFMNNITRALPISIRFRELKLHALSKFKRESGLASQRGEGPPLVVSLTSFSPRFAKLHITLESLLNQSLKPNSICLWIAEEEEALLPNSVTRLKERGLSILKCPDIRSYKKIIFALKQFDDAVIVTADDDIIYPKDWLSSLYKAHLIDPGTIICHRGRLMTFNQFGEINPYRFWPLLEGEHKSELVFPVGAGGVLYPPKSLSDQVLKQELFLNLCPHGDDIWLKVMSLLNGRECKRISHFRKHFKMVKGSQEVSLKGENMASRNDFQIQAVFDHFDVQNFLTRRESI